MTATAETPTIHLRDWVPALAQEIHGKRWSPNLDTVTHLEAQRIAYTLDIGWAADMPETDVATISDALRALYVERNTRRRK